MSQLLKNILTPPLNFTLWHFTIIFYVTFTWLAIYYATLSRTKHYIKNFIIKLFAFMTICENNLYNAYYCYFDFKFINNLRFICGFKMRVFLTKIYVTLNVTSSPPLVKKCHKFTIPPPPTSLTSVMDSPLQKYCLYLNKNKYYFKRF